MSQPRITELPGDHLLGCSDEDAAADHLRWHSHDRVLERGPVVRGGRISSARPSRNSCDSHRRSRASIAQRASITRSERRPFQRAHACCSPGARPTVTHANSTIPTSSVPSATRRAMWRSAPASIYASARKLARMEGQAILREIVDNVDRIEVVGTPTWTTNPNLRGLMQMNVRLTPRQQVA